MEYSFHFSFPGEERARQALYFPAIRHLFLLHTKRRLVQDSEAFPYGFFFYIATIHLRHAAG